MSPFALQSKYSAIYDLSSSINKWRILCQTILMFFERSSSGFNTFVSFFHSARAQWTGGHAFILMLFRLFVSVKRARHRNARATTARPFIEINIPEATRRFYTELAGVPTRLVPDVYLAPVVEWLGLSALGTSKALKRFDFHTFPCVRAFKS